MLFIAYRDKPDDAIYSFKSVGDIINIGRDKRFCQICFGANAEGVSRIHMRMQFKKIGRQYVLSAEDLSSFGTGYNGGPFKIVKQRNLKVGDILQFGRNYLIINELRPSTSNADEVFEDDVAEAPSNSYSVQNIFEKKKFNIRSVSNKNEKAKLFLLSSDDEDDDIIDQSSSTIFAFDTLRQSLKSQYYRKVSDNIDHTKWISSNYPTGVVSESCVVKDDTVHNQADDRFVVKCGDSGRKTNGENSLQFVTSCKRRANNTLSINEPKSKRSYRFKESSQLEKVPSQYQQQLESWLQMKKIKRSFSSSQNTDVSEIEPKEAKLQKLAKISDDEYKITRGNANSDKEDATSKNNPKKEEGREDKMEIAEEIIADDINDCLIFGMDKETVRRKLIKAVAFKNLVKNRDNNGAILGQNTTATIFSMTNFKRFRKAAQGRYADPQTIKFKSVLSLIDMIDYRRIKIQ